MRRVLLLLLLTGVAGVAGGADFSNHATIPDKNTYVGDNLGDRREGGESWGDAIPIGSLPYNDSGATCDNIDDITLPCAASAAPDVVYRYTATFDGPLIVHLCGSGYDTALGIYDQNQNNIVCNDDFCGLQSEIDNVFVSAGHTYYIVVDGFSTNCGSYVLTVNGGIGTPVNCPEGAPQEGEPPCQDNYYDAYNGGCNSSGWTPLCPQEGNAVVLCGKSGTYSYNGLSYRDTDWFSARGTGGAMTATVVAQFPVQLILIYGTDCNNLVYDLITGGPNQEVSLSHFMAEGAGAWIWVGPCIFNGIPCESDYTLTVSGTGRALGCLGFDPASVDEVDQDAGPENETTSWGKIKSAFR